jgi:hypothetical protein
MMTGNKILSILSVAFFILLPLTLIADPTLNGKWILNKKDSDDPRRKFEEARKNGSGGEHDHSRGEWGHHGGRGGEFHGGGERGGQADDRMKALDEITIQYTSPSFTITDKDGAARTYYTDGRTTEIEDPGPRLRKVTATVEGDQITLNSTTRDGGESAETYYLSPDANRLYVKVRMKPIMMDEAITFVRVYDRYPPQKEN